MIDYTCGRKLNLLNSKIRTWREKKKFKTSWSNVAEKMLLIISELCEAFEGFRDLSPRFITLLKRDPKIVSSPMSVEESAALANFKEELADTYIRLGDLCASLGIDIKSHIHQKMQVNEGRPTRHGRQR